MGELVSPDQSSPPPAPRSLQLQVDWGKERPGSCRALPGLPDPLSLLSWEERQRQTQGCLVFVRSV